MRLAGAPNPALQATAKSGRAWAPESLDVLELAVSRKEAFPCHVSIGGA